MAKRIETKDLDIYYGSFHAVESVNLIVEPRTVTAFIGPSGCGKSTVLRTSIACTRSFQVPTAPARWSSTGLTCTAKASTRWPCDAMLAWSSSEPTPSRQCPSEITS